MEHKSITRSSPPTRVVRPFDSEGWSPVRNGVFDVIMPRLSPNAWKVLCVVIRQSWGWVARPGGDPRQRREWDRISYSQFQAKTGIGSRTTISRALSECMQKGYLLRYQVGTERGQPIYVYGLNEALELEVEVGDSVFESSASGIRPVTGAGMQNGSVAATEPEPGSVARPGNGPTTPSYPQVRPLIGPENGPVTVTGPQDGLAIGQENGPVTGSKCGLTKQKVKQTQGGQLL